MDRGTEAVPAETDTDTESVPAETGTDTESLPTETEAPAGRRWWHRPRRDPATKAEAGSRPGDGAGPGLESGGGAEPKGRAESGAGIEGAAAELGAGSGAGSDAGAGAGGGSKSLSRRVVVGGVVVGLVLALSGGVLLYQAHELRDTPAAANHALTDVEATTRVNGDVSSALAKVFSYTPGGTDATARSAEAVLSGRAAEQYKQLFAQVKDNVRKQHLTLTTQSVRVGTVSLRGTTAHLLVFLDQTARRGDKKPATSAAQLSVTARLRDDVWQIVDIKAR
ncbi:hypothetical protein AB0J38_03055 [Streptomyces sp. NPDC050095]|uniref:hypothetical protein n=1 Tax=unclassified Streptomyces TaxID=2593676 RepID=UPI0034186B5D